MARIMIVTAHGKYVASWHSLNDFIRLFQIGGIMQMRPLKPDHTAGAPVHVPWGAVMEIFSY